MEQSADNFTKKNKWKRGVLKIILETGKSPTKYSDKSAPSDETIDQLREQHEKLIEHKNNIINSTNIINICYPNYNILKKDLNKCRVQSANWFNRIVYPVSKDIMCEKKQNVQKIERQYNSLSEEEKHN